jgi:hypothetical protein
MVAAIEQARGCGVCLVPEPSASGACETLSTVCLAQQQLPCTLGYGAVSQFS